jgi:hypothetical protein
MAIAGERFCGRRGAPYARARYCTRLSQRSVDKAFGRKITARKEEPSMASVRIRHRFPSSDREHPRRTALSPTPPFPDTSGQLSWRSAQWPQPQWRLLEAIERTQTGPNRITVRSTQGSCRSRCGAIQSNRTATLAAALHISATARQPHARSRDTNGHCKRRRLTVQVKRTPVPSATLPRASVLAGLVSGHRLTPSWLGRLTGHSLLWPIPFYKPD